MDDAKVTNPDPHPGIKWSDLEIERECAYLPEELREPYVWLKVFTREECHKDAAVLTDCMRRVGVDRDKTTWSKILRGRWNRDARGEPLVSPVIGKEKLLEEIAALRTNTRVEAQRGRIPFVYTQTVKTIHQYIDIKRGADRVNRFGIVVGATGTGKTAAFKEYKRIHNHGATFWFEAPATGSLGAFIGRLSACSGLSEQTSIPKQRAHLLKVLRPEKCIIIDNVQDLYRVGRIEQPAFSYLRELQDETGCCIILSITPTFEKTLVDGLISGYFEQFEGRSGGRRKWLRLTEYPTDEDVMAIAEAFGVKDAKANRKNLIALARRPGRIRPLFDDLQDAKLSAASRKEPLTWSIINEILED